MYSRKRKRFSPLMIAGLCVPLVLALIAGGVFTAQKLTGSHAAAVPNPNCTLIVPANALTAKGLSTPYQLTATNAGNGPCNEANAVQSAFVQADIINPANGAVTAYTPLVIDKGTKAAIAPIVPVLPQGAIVGLWFGFNGTFLHLGGNAGGANCVNGVGKSDFGQFAYCNAPNFFKAANAAIAAKKLVVPALGTALDGQACPTTRAFAVVDMDQSDNVQTQYLANANGQTALFNAANQAKLANAITLGNPSDNALVTRFLDPALGCQSFQVPNLAAPGTTTATLATDELQAAATQKAPVALIPAGDEMVLVNAAANLNKVNAYRRGVDQAPAANLNGANTTNYCKNLVTVSLPRLQLDMNRFMNQASPDGGATANSLFTFLANRLNASLGAGGLNCVGLLKIQNPVALTTNGNGVVTAAVITVKPVAANAAAAPAVAGAAAAPAGATAATSAAGDAGTGPKAGTGNTTDAKRPADAQMPLW